MDEFSWASAVGRIRVLEKNLMPRASLLALSEARDLGAALGMLKDSPYGPYLSRMENNEDFEKPLEKCLKDEFDYIENMAPEAIIIEAFRSRYDFHNLKVLTKARLLDMAPDAKAMSILGNLDAKELVGAISSAMSRGSKPDEMGEDLSQEGHKGISPRMSSVIKAYVEMSAREKSSEDFESAEKDEATFWLRVDSLIDRVYYDMLSDTYRRSGYEGLMEFGQNEVDMVNLKMFFRAKRQNITSSTYQEIALSGGHVSKDSLAEAYERDPSQVPRAYSDTPWVKLAENGGSLVGKNQSLTKWEKQCDNTLINVSRKFKTYPLGPEPAIGYMFGREVEVRNLRIILTGKEAMVSPEEISERLRDTYA